MKMASHGAMSSINQTAGFPRQWLSPLHLAAAFVASGCIGGVSGDAAEGGFAGRSADGFGDEAPLRVCLVPGHPGDESDYSKAFEGVINRKVAFLLQDLLVEAGYEVLIVTSDIPREELFSEGFDNEDPEVHARLRVLSLEDRAAACNDWSAAAMISIHHNDAGPDLPGTNYSLVLYNQHETGPYLVGARFPIAVDWAQRTAAALGETMEVDGSSAEGDLLYLGYRLRVLRLAEMPAILTEASFYSNAAERRRLNDDEYLRREAGAIFSAFVETWGA